MVSPGGWVLGLEIREDIVEFSRQNVAASSKLRGFEFQGYFENRNCFIPDIEERTFDRVHTGACCPERYLPKLVALLKPGGILVTPSGKFILFVLLILFCFWLPDRHPLLVFQGLTW